MCNGKYIVDIIDNENNVIAIINNNMYYIY